MSISTRVGFMFACVSLAAVAVAGCGGGTTSPADMSLVCTAPQVLCTDRCVDTTQDDQNCGACAVACKPGEACVAGACAVACPAGQSVCAGKCVSTDSDRANCGACATACQDGEVCSSGKCGLVCANNLANCSGTCRDITADPANCGACATACQAGQVCSSGKCMLACPGALVNCTGSCRDTQIDAANCGGCAMPCKAGEVCTAGVCKNGCGALANCSGVCVDTGNDPANCGACAMPCKAGEVCTAGACKNSCGALAYCSGVCVDTGNDPANCGGCAMACAAGLSCVAGQCKLVCAGGAMLCNGLCVNVLTDDQNCGTCGTACPAGAQCQMGTCNCTLAGTAMCNQVCIETLDDVANCGGCANVCTLANAVPACAKGSCILSGCNAGYMDCNKMSADGCEVNLLTDSANCGACGVQCGAGLHCSGGVCHGKCYDNAAWGAVSCTDLSWDWSLDRSLATDRATANTLHVLATSMGNNNNDKCSVSGSGWYSTAEYTESLNQCDTLMYHLGGSFTGNCAGHSGEPYRLLAIGENDCYLTNCAANLADCDGDPANGCEANLTTDALNCGACGKKPNIMTDSNNCGACGNVCPAGNHCANGMCRGACLDNAKWAAVACTNPSWDWSLDRTKATDRTTANTQHVLATSNGNNNDKCSVLGNGYYSTQEFTETLSQCNTLMYHLGGTFTGNCGGHSNEPYRYLVLGDNDCYAY